jgi:subtilisin family serine protease
MKRLLQLFLLFAMLLDSARADQRLIVRITGGQSLLNTVCFLLRCSIIRGLGDPLAQVFLIGIPDATNLTNFISSLSLVTGVLGIEIDQVLKLSQSLPLIPPALSDSTQVAYAGASVREGYLNQPATGIVRLFEAQNAFNVSGGATVAVIDTGVDPAHPVLSPVLQPGYDFTRNSGNGSETGDVTQSTAAVVDGSWPAYVSPNAAAVVDQSTANNLNTSQYADFGHGTMVAGIVHLVAPTAQIIPLKAFGADGSGYISDVVRAIYRAVNKGATVINMSFSTSLYSPELKNAVNHATGSGAICVAAAGNEGKQTTVYPAAISGVIGVASTTNDDVRSSFSNYGSGLVWVGAPGEGVITTYPFGSWAAAWGTSFSAPFVSGTAALLLQARGGLSPAGEASAIGHAKALTSDLAHGRLDIYTSLQAAVGQ